MTPRLTLSALVLSLLASQAFADREKLLLDRGWRFAFGNASDASKDFRLSDGGFSYLAKAGSDAGPISLGFPDARWRTVNLPHDWAIELPFDPKSDLNHGFKPIGRDFPQNSVGWYRRTLTVPKTDEGRRLRITFDGAFRDSRVWINGHYLGRSESGYAPFSFDVTDVVKYGQQNVISVRVDASEAEGWFYEGAGIYRHVWLEKFEPAHIDPESVFVATELKGQDAKVTVRADLVNEGEKPVDPLDAMIFLGEPSPEGERFAFGGKTEHVRLAPGERRSLAFQLTIPKARLWSPEKPFLYRLHLNLGRPVPQKKNVGPVGGVAVAAMENIDVLSLPVGVRTLAWDADRGFLLNGKPYKILGTCNHQDHAGVGAALPDSDRKSVV